MIRRYVVDIDTSYRDPAEEEDVASALEYGFINQQHRYDFELTVRLHQCQPEGKACRCLRR